MKISISPELKHDLVDALWDLELERVCVFFGKVRARSILISRVVEAENIHANPYDHFALGRHQWRALGAQAGDLGLALVGFGHSHPPPHPAEPSADDLAMVRRYSHLKANAVYHVRSSTLTWYTSAGITSQEQINQALWVRLLTRLAA